MATGLALAVTDEPTVSAIIEPDVTGLTYPHGNIIALAEVLRTLVANPALRKRLGQAARMTVQSKYRIEETTASVVHALQSSLSR